MKTGARQVTQMTMEEVESEECLSTGRPAALTAV